ncbi:beta strand repeat-containing protein [Maribacter sp. Asnod1-A12]|uniref:beta strand repeat-containing protein n=1 Tax=Maribacter sp. Asnod1-A12 TaxID=3160576 RepID=UPI003864919E
MKTVHYTILFLFFNITFLLAQDGFNLIGATVSIGDGASIRVDDGDFLVSNEGSITNSAFISVDGDWLNNNSTGQVFSSNSEGTVNLTKTATVTTIGGSTTTVFYNLTLDVDEVTLEVNTIVGGSISGNNLGILDLKNVELDLNSNTLQITNSLIGAIISDEGYIVSEDVLNQSKVLWQTSPTGGEYTVPFGTVSGVQIPLTIERASGDLGEITVSTYPTGLDMTPFPSQPENVTNILDESSNSLVNNSLNRFWQLDKSGSGTANLTLTYADDDLPANGENNLFTYRYDTASNAWQKKGTSSSSLSNNTVTIAGVNEFSPWTLSATPENIDGDGLSNAEDIDDDNDGIPDDIENLSCAVFSEDFGTGSYPGGELTSGYTTYNYRDDITEFANFPDALDDGDYTIANLVNQPEGSWQPNLGDHTTGSGYMMVVNASYTSGDFYNRTVTLLPDSTYKFTAWLVNANSEANETFCNGETGGYILPNVKYEIRDLDNASAVIASFDTGDIPRTGEWQNYNFEFNTGTSTNIEVVLINNNTGGCGNDLALDDISLIPITLSGGTVACDFDGDGIPNSEDLDSDNDGIYDIIEAGGTDADNNGVADNLDDLDSDGLVDIYDGSCGVASAGPLNAVGANVVQNTFTNPANATGVTGLSDTGAAVSGVNTSKLVLDLGTLIPSGTSFTLFMAHASGGSQSGQIHQTDASGNTVGTILDNEYTVTGNTITEYTYTTNADTQYIQVTTYWEDVAIYGIEVDFSSTTDCSGTALTPPETTPGTPDFLNQDSDGDACTDAKEAGFTDADEDGEVDGTGYTTYGSVDGSDGYTGTTSAVTDGDNSVACGGPAGPDNDGDLVLDVDDLDDDNDGILDAEELSLCTQTRVEWEHNDSETPNASTVGTTDPGDSDYATYDSRTLISSPNFTSAANISFGSLNETGSQYTYVFDNANQSTFAAAKSANHYVQVAYTPAVDLWTQNIAIGFYSSNSGPEKDYGDFDMTLEMDTNASFSSPTIKVQDLHIDDMIANGYLPYSIASNDYLTAGTTYYFRFYIYNNQNGTGLTRFDDVGFEHALACDTDLDGVPNYFDLDSDNDGIYDAVEAGHNAAHTNGEVTGNVGTDGVPDAVQGGGNEDAGTVNYTILDSEATPDGIADYLDLDSDGDGLPDNIEAQTTTGYTAPIADDVATYETNKGVNSAYLGGITPENTDGADTPDYLDLDSDNEGADDTTEAGLTLANADADNDGLDDNTDATADYSDPNGTIDDPTLLPNTQNSGDPQVDYRDDGIIDPCGSIDTDNDGYFDNCDDDDDNDGILDTDEGYSETVTNYLANPSFESNDPTIGNSRGGSFLGPGTGNVGVAVDDWDLVWGTADLYDNTTISGFSASDGDYYIGFHSGDGASESYDTSSANTREVVVHNLAAPLLAGVEYIFTFDMAASTFDSNFSATSASIEFYTINVGNTAIEGDDDSDGIYNYSDLDYIDANNLYQDGTTVGALDDGNPGIEYVGLYGPVDEYSNGWTTITFTFTPSSDIDRLFFTPTSGVSEAVLMDNLILEETSATFTSIDTDGDGTADHLDTDADNDGCPDALEGDGTYTYSDLDSELRLTATVDGNGIPSGTSQGAGTSLDNTQQADECSPCDPSHPSYADSDGDLVGDYCDEDDDNDGILDTVECIDESGFVNITPDVLKTYSSAFSAASGSGRVLNYSESDIDISAEFGLPVGNIILDVSNISENSAQTYWATDVTDPGNNGAYPNFTFSGTRALYFRALHGPNIPTEMAYDGIISDGTVYEQTAPLEAQFIEDNSVPNEYRVQRTTSTGDTSNSPNFFTWNSLSTTSSITFTTTNDTPTGVTSRYDLYVVPQIDSDGDGIGDCFDSDSDNDGCPDALEGDGNYTYADLDSELRLTAAVDGDGIPSGTSQGVGTSLDNAQQADECSECDPSHPSYVDSDGDLVGDFCDEDDDNDGILDTEEDTCTGYTVVRPSDLGYTGNEVIASAVHDVSNLFGLSTGAVILTLTDAYVNATGSSWNTSGSNPASSIAISGTIPSRLRIDHGSGLTSVGSKEGIRSNGEKFSFTGTLNTGFTSINQGNEYYVERDASSASNDAGTEIWESDGYASFVEFFTTDNASVVIFRLCPATDTDNDGIANHLDTDSDNDGCPDALEGNGTYTYADIDSNLRLTAAVDGDGIPSGTSQGIGTSLDNTQQADECSPCDPSHPSYVDSDGDLVGDYCDEDDDNDGILDTNECALPVVDADYNNWTKGSGWSAVGDGSSAQNQSNGANNATLCYTVNDVSSVSNATKLTFELSIRTNGNSDNIINGRYADLDFTINGTEYATFRNPNDNISSDATVTTLNGATASLATFPISTTSGSFTTLTVTVPWSGATSIDICYSMTADNDDWNVSTTLIASANNYSCDTDDDGIANHLDTDSDNDGCTDTLEAGHLDANNDGEVDGSGYDTDGRVTGATTAYTGTTTGITTAAETSIDTAPTDQEERVGDDATFTVVASALDASSYTSGTPTYDVNADAGLTYQWQVSTNSGSTFSNISGATNASLTISDVTLIMDGNIYKVLVSSTNNTCSEEAEATLTVINNVDAINDVAGITAIEGFTGVTDVLNVFDNDEFNGAALNPASVTITPVTNGPLTVNGDGSVDVANNTGTGSYTVNYQICDTDIDNLTNCDTATVTVNVAVNSLPTAQDDEVSIAQDTSNNSIDVLANNGNGPDTFGGDGPNSGAITLPSTTTTNGGTVSIDDNSTPLDPTDDTVLYTPAASYSGADSFTYTITDANNDTDTATVNVTVVPTPTIAINVVAVDDIINATEDDSPVTISGTTTNVEDGQIATVVLNGTTYSPVVTGNAWTFDITALEAQALDANETITADVSNAAGNPATQATRDIQHDVTTPTIAINVVAVDDIINATEDDSPVTISGTTTDVEDGQIATVVLNGTTYSPVVTGNAWTFDITATEAQALDATETITADVSNAAGNPAVQATRDIQHDVTTPVITINVVAVDDIINATEDDSPVTISGTTTDVEDGQIATVVLNGTTYSPVVTGNTWTFDITAPEAQALDATETITADVSNDAGNPATQATRDIQHDVTTPTIAINVVAVDDIINATEDDSPVTISGTTTDVEDGQIATVVLNGTTYSPVVTAGVWTFDITALEAQALDATETITADVSNDAGNPATQATRDIQYDATLPVPVLEIDDITADNILNAAEAGADVAVTGTVSGDFNDGDTVTLTVDGTDYTGTVDALGAYSIDIPGSKLAADADTTVDGSVTTTDTAGNSASATDTQVYSVNTTAPAIVINTVAGDDIINATEDDSPVTISGTTTNVEDGQIAIVVLNGTTYSPVVTAGVWTFDITALEAQALDPTETITADVSDLGGNPATQATRDIQYDAALPVPILDIDDITADNILNAAEAGADVAVTGTVSGDFNDGDTVTLTVDGTDYTGTVDALGAYSIDVPGSKLAADADTTVDGSVTTTDTAGNSASATDTQLYSLDTTLPVPILEIDDITADNILNAAEAGADVAVTGTVSGDFNDGDTVTLTVDGTDYTGTVDALGAYSIDVPGSKLAADADTTVDGSVTTTDTAGNSASATDTQLYSLDML